MHNTGYKMPDNRQFLEEGVNEVNVKIFYKPRS